VLGEPVDEGIPSPRTPSAGRSIRETPKFVDLEPDGGVETGIKVID